MGTDGSGDSFLTMSLLVSLVVLFRVLFILIAWESGTDDANGLVLVLSIIKTLIRYHVPHHYLVSGTAFQVKVNGVNTCTVKICTWMVQGRTNVAIVSTHWKNPKGTNDSWKFLELHTYSNRNGYASLFSAKQYTIEKKEENVGWIKKKCNTKVNCKNIFLPSHKKWDQK